MIIGIKAKLVNHNLAMAIQDLGYKSVNKFCVENGFNPVQVGLWLNLKKVPKYKSLCNRLEQTLKQPIDFLFPPDLVRLVHKKPETRFYFHKEIKTERLEDTPQKLLSYDAESKNEKYEGLEIALSSLSEKEQQILKLRFGIEGEEKTQKEIGEMFGVGQTRIMQIEKKALKKLRHPERAKTITDTTVK